MNRRAIFDAINAERQRQDELHPEWHGNEHGLVVLAVKLRESYARI